VKNLTTVVGAGDGTRSTSSVVEEGYFRSRPFRDSAHECVNSFSWFSTVTTRVESSSGEIPEVAQWEAILKKLRIFTMTVLLER
jgi:hypothetical protein